MTNLLLNTSSKDYYTLIGNGAAYHVPPYQRDYSWSEDQWDDLWSDIIGLEIEKHHYLGYIVLQQHQNDKDFWVIDGQQRFTTLALLSLAVEQLMDEWSNDSALLPAEQKDNKERKDALHKRFLGNYSTSKLTTTSKLFLNKNNNDFFASYLLAFREPSKAAKLKPSQKLLYKAYTFFQKKLREKFPQPDGAGLAQFIEEDVAPRLIFTTIEVSDELNAYKVFETLNARGVHLSPSDLLKNYLFSLAVKDENSDFVEAERLWQSINDKLSEGDLPTFLRHFWNSRHSFVRSAELYRSIKQKIRNQEDVFLFLREVDSIADMYVALNDPSHSLWSKEQKYSIKILKLFGISACYPLLMTAYEKLKPNEFTQLLYEMVNLTFRRTIIGHLSTNELEPAFNRASLGLYNNDFNTAKKVYGELRSLQVSDAEFQSSFALKEFAYPNRKAVIRYIMAELENHLSDKGLQFDIDPFTIEHVLPQNPGDVWEQEFSLSQQEEFLNRLGNLTLLDEKSNNSKRMNNDKSFVDKKRVYEKSAYLLTQRLAKYAQWSPASIEDRQNKMAELAIHIWKSAFAD